MMSTNSPSGALLAASLSSSSKSLMPRGGACLQRSGRDGVDANAARPQFIGEIATGRFQRGLDRSHDIVVRNHLVGAIVAHREHRAALCHQGGRKLGHS